MSDAAETPNATPLPVEDVARAAAELAAEVELDRLLARFLERVREWAAPSAVLAAVRDPGADSGWRLLPALSVGSGPLGAERALPQLVDETPGCLEHPVVVHPGEPAPGVQARDNCILPWSHEGESGILVIRGIPRPSRSNLGEALALLSAPVWPRLVGSPATRVESLVVDLRRLAERFEADAERQIERLRAAQPAAGEGEPGNEPAAREQLTDAREEAARATAERDEVRERLLAVETALKETEAERDRALGEEKKLESLREEVRRAASERDDARDRLQAAESAFADLETQRDAARGGIEEAETRRREAEEKALAAQESLAATKSELDAARSEGEHSTLEWDELKGRVATLQEALEEAEVERDRGRDESERLSARIESMQTEHAAAVEKAEEQRRAAEESTRSTEESLAEARKKLEAVRGESERAASDEEDLKGRVAQLEEDLQRARTERDEAQAALDRLEGDRRSASDTARDLEDELAGLRRDLESARQDSQKAVAEAGEMRARVGSLETTLQEVEAERDGARGQVEILEDEKREAEATARTAEEALAGVREQLEQARSEEAPAPSRPVVFADDPGGAAEKALGALRGTLDVLRRTPFVPPGLRVSMEEGASALGETAHQPDRWLRVALLDRDAGSLASLADELEDAGVDVRVANYPEELALLVKTPDAQDLNAVICDILAFRPDQTVAGLFRAWEKDRPGLAFLLSFNPEDAAEAERAKRVPISLTSGRLGRPIPTAELIEKLQVLAKKQAAQ